MSEFKASNVDEAIRIGLETLGLSREQAVIEVLDQGGFLRKARVEISKKAQPSDAVVKFIEDIAKFLDADGCTYEVSETNERITVLISGESAGKLIGYRGDVLDSLQYIASAILNKDHKNRKRVTIDCENYREKREESLKNLAERLAQKAVRTARKVRLEPMNPAERRIIHSALQGNEEVETVSVGNEPNRYLTIVPKNLKKDRRGGKADFNGKSDRGNDKRNDRKDQRRDDRGSRAPAPKKSFLGFGSYLGNTRTSLEKERLEEKKQAFRENQYVEPETPESTEE